MMRTVELTHNDCLASLPNLGAVTENIFRGCRGESSIDGIDIAAVATL